MKSLKFQVYILLKLDGDFGCISKLRPKLKNLVLSKNKSNKELSEIYTKFHSSYLIVPSQLKENLIPSFNPILKLEDVFKKHYISFFIIFINDSLSDSEFSTQFKVNFTLLIGEVLSTLSVGFSKDQNIALQFLKLNLERVLLDVYED